MSNARHFQNKDLAAHVNAHANALGHEFSKEIVVEALSSSGEFPIWVPPLVGYQIRRVICVQDADLMPDATDYWLLQVFELDDQGGERILVEWDGSEMAFTEGIPSILPNTGNLDADLTIFSPLRLRLTENGTPDPITNLLVQVVIGLK